MIPRVIPVRGPKADRLLNLSDTMPAPAEQPPEPATPPVLPVGTPRRRDTAPAAPQRVHVPPLLAIIVGSALAALALIALTRFLPSAGPMRASQATAGAAGSDAAPGTTPTRAPAAPAARSLVAFAAPNGGVLGAIEATRPMTATAHYGTDWLQVDAAGSGLVWLRAADAPELAIVGPDLMPTPTPAPTATPIPPTPLPATPIPPTPEPTCVQVGTTPSNMISRCGYEALEQLQADAQAAWMQQNGAQPARVATVTPYPTIVRSR